MNAHDPPLWGGPRQEKVATSSTIDNYAFFTAAASPITPTIGDDTHRAYVLGWLRCLHARMAMFINEIDYIGVSLKGNFVMPDEALVWLYELDPILLNLIIGAREGGR